MNDAVDRVIIERESLDRGFSRSVLLSLSAHLMLAGAAVAAPLLFPKAPPKLNVAMGVIVPLPPGGGGSPQGVEPAPAVVAPKPQAPKPPEPQAKPAPKPKILKPPKKETRKGLPEPDARKRRRAPTPTPTPASGTPGATGSATATRGLQFLPPGPGAPGGTDVGGDWYLAGVQRKIWLLWANQIRTGPDRSVIVSFTIEADGSVTDVRVVQSSGIYLLDQAAQRAIYSAAPFGSLPKHYGTNQLTIQAVFKPVG